MTRRHFHALSAVAPTREDEPAGSPLVTFGLIADVQYVDAEPEGERHFRESIPKLKAAVDDLASLNLPFTLHLGDLIDRDFFSFTAVLPLFGGLGHPVRHLLGNHDYSIADAEKGKVVETLGMPSDYYIFQSAGVRFVMLDTNEVSTYKYGQGSEEELAAEAMMEKLASGGLKNAVSWNGGVSPAQLEWLEKQLAAADMAGEPVIVCGHHPLLPEEGHHAWNSRDILEVIERHKSSRAYLCGHQHAGAEAVFKGLPCITFKSLLHQPGVTAFSVVSLFKDRLVIDGRGREKSREIPLRPV